MPPQTCEWLPFEKLNESLVLGVSESGEAESFPLVKKVTRSTALQIANKRVGNRNPFRFEKKWLRGPQNNRGKTRGAFGGDWNKAHGVASSQAERIPLPHYSGPRGHHLRWRLGSGKDSASPLGVALTEWGSISPERVARAAKQALCGVNPFRFGLARRVEKRNPFRFKLKMAPWTAE